MSLNSSRANGSAALFARADRNSEQVILPLNGPAEEGRQGAPAFYCVHSVSGVAGTDFLGLAHHLQSEVRFYGVQAPPKKIREPSFGQSIESLGSYYSDALEAFQPTGRMMLGGYCVGAVIALEVAKQLRHRGRDVGPLLAIDGVPENTGVKLTAWRATYWRDLIQNVPRWLRHADLMRNATLKSIMWSLSKNAFDMGGRAAGLRRGRKPDGIYTIDRFMDLSIYPDFHRAFINRLYNALFQYVPGEYPAEVVIYEATVNSLLNVPEIGRIWTRYAPRSEVVAITGTHISIMCDPYVEALARDAAERITAYFRGD